MKDYILKLNQDTGSADDVKYCIQMLAAVNGSVMTYLIQQIKNINQSDTTRLSQIMLVNTVSNISIKSLTNPLPTAQNLSESHTGIYVATLQLKRYLFEILA